MKKSYTIKDIVQALKIPRPRFTEWVWMGYVKASIQSRGSGTANLYSKTDVYRIALFLHLISIGFKREIAADRCHKFEPKGLSKTFDATKKIIINTSQTLHFSSSIKDGVIEHHFFVNDEADAVMDGEWDDMIIINMEKIRRRVDEVLN